MIIKSPISSNGVMLKMAENSKFPFYIGSFVFVIVGYLVSLFVEGILGDVLPTTTILEVFTPIRIALFFNALVWFVVLFLVFWGSTMFIDYGEKNGLLSLTFFITWICVAFGMVIAVIIHSLLATSSVTLNLDLLIDAFFGVLLLSLGPTIAALLGLSNKEV